MQRKHWQMLFAGWVVLAFLAAIGLVLWQAGFSSQLHAQMPASQGAKIDDAVSNITIFAIIALTLLSGFGFIGGLFLGGTLWVSEKKSR